MDKDTVVFAGWYLSPSQQLAECWDTHAMSLAFSTICTAPRHDTTTGFLIYLPEIIQRSAEDSAIVLSCRAIGTAFLTCQIATTEAQSKRAGAYGKALAATNAALKDSAVQTRDETLASIWLLSLYEVRTPLSVMS